MHTQKQKYIRHQPQSKALPPQGKARLRPGLLAALLALAALTAPPLAGAATVWNGPTMTFSKAAGTDPTLPANQDRITANVWVTRGANQGIYNAKTESAYSHNLSPADTEWAFGTTANYASLTYTSWEDWYGGSLGGGPISTVGANAVVHLITDDIYIDIKFTSWGIGLAGAGAFSYERSTAGASPNTPPTVAITSPTDGTALGLPVNITITADAADPGGSVASVQFFDGATALGTDAAPLTASPWTFIPGSIR